jgi:transcriptional antiterminator Rof (Rho-off)
MKGEKFMSKAFEMTDEQMKEYLALKKAKEAQALKTKQTGERLRAKTAVYVQKAKLAGITVSEKEIEAEMARPKK